MPPVGYRHAPRPECVCVICPGRAATNSKLSVKLLLLVSECILVTQYIW